MVLFYAGRNVRGTLRGSTLELDWSGVFEWKGAGHLVYVLYVGTEVGAANLVTGVLIDPN